MIGKQPARSMMTNALVMVVGVAVVIAALAPSHVSASSTDMDAVLAATTRTQVAANEAIATAQRTAEDAHAQLVKALNHPKVTEAVANKFHSEHSTARFRSRRLGTCDDEPAASQGCCPRYNSLLSTLTSSKCGQFASLFSGGVDSTIPPAALPALCASDCAADLRAVMAMSNPDNSTTGCDRLEPFVGVVEGACIQSPDGTFCYPAFQRLVSSMSSPGSTSGAGGSLTSASLNKLCHPCIRTIFRFLQELAVSGEAGDFGSDISAAFGAFEESLDLICLKDPGSGAYCLASDAPTITDTCSFCGQKIVRKTIDLLRSFGTTTPEQEDQIDLLELTIGCYCASNGGATCSRLFSSGAAGIPDGCLNILTTADQTCEGLCKSTIATTANALGCCMPCLLRLLEASDDSGATYPAVSSMLANAEANCGISEIPLTCSSTPAQVSLRIRNLKYSWVTANPTRQAMFENAIKSSISKTTGVETSTIVDLELSEGSVVADYKIDTGSNTNNQIAAISLQQASASGVVDLNDVITVVGGDSNDAYEDPSQPLYTTVTYNGGLASATPSVAVFSVVFLALATLFNRWI